MFREDYNRLNEQVKPSNNLIVTTIKKTEQIDGKGIHAGYLFLDSLVERLQTIR